MAENAERIDAHHHLWRYTPEEYGWMGPEMGPGMHVLRRDYLPGDLEAAGKTAGVSGTVVVQARQSVAETEWLLALAEASPWLRGVVGWAPLASPEVGPLLKTLAGRRKLSGLRHVIQDEPDENFMRGEAFNAGLALLAEAGLVYDLLITETQLPQASALVGRHPQQVFVLDHLAKPRIRERVMQPWADELRRLAEHKNVYCKLSGMVTEADLEGWTAEDLAPYLDQALEAFGAERLMAGSDWPVCLLASSYERWWSTLEQWAARLGAEHRDLVMGGTAVRVYGL
ncbi:MAG TPA: amidohydrolase family protein [Acidobacteriaceae bacterium]